MQTLLILEGRLNSKLVHALNQAAYVVRQYFAEHFINLRVWQLASNESAKLRLDHTERGLDVRPLMIMIHEIRSVPSSSGTSSLLLRHSNKMGLS